MIKILIFDFDGVLINEFEAHLETYMKRFSNFSKEEFLRIGEGNFHKGKEKLKERDSGIDYSHEFYEKRLSAKIDPKIIEQLQEFKKKYTIGMVTSGEEEKTIQVLKNNNIEDIFSFVWGKETHLEKSIKLKMVLEKFNVTKEECLFVTDTLGDIREANSVGIACIAVDYGYHSAETLAKGNPKAIVSDFITLKEFLD